MIGRQCFVMCDIGVGSGCEGESPPETTANAARATARDEGWHLNNRRWADIGGPRVDICPYCWKALNP